MIATPQNSAPCRVFDANGLEWKHMRWVDTETGEAEQVVTDANGFIQLTPNGKAVATAIVRLAAPVLLVPTGEARMPVDQEAEPPADQRRKQKDRTGYAHLQFTGVIPLDMAIAAKAMLQQAMERRPSDCGGVLYLCQPDANGKLEYDETLSVEWKGGA